MKISTKTKHYLAGFLDGEGSFGITDSGNSMGVKLRADDLPVLESLRSELGGMGKLRFVRDVGTARGRNNNPCVSWIVTKRSDLLALDSVLEGGKILRAKKRADYSVWRKSLLEKERGTATKKSHLALRDELRAGRVYDPAVAAVQLSTVTK